MLAGSGLAALVRVAAWVVLVGASGVSAAGFALPCAPVTVGVVLAAPVALLALVSTLSSVWRGPPIISLVPEQAARCGATDARLLRDSAQLRGAMGGAGFVHRTRLVFPAFAWASALLAGADGIAAGCAFDPPGAWVFLLSLAGVVAAWLWPSRPYWYLEADGGGALVTPPETVAAITSARAAEHGREASEERPGRPADPAPDADSPRTTLRSLGMVPPPPPGLEEGEEESLDGLPPGAGDELAGRRRPPRHRA